MMGMTPATLYDLELAEFNAAYQGWNRLQEQQLRQMWELARWHGAISLSPHVKNSGNIMQMLPLPWDRIEPNTEELSIEERLARASEMLKHLKK